MELWFIFLIFSTFSISLILKRLLSRSTAVGRLPPSPATVPLIGNILWLRRLRELESILKSLYAKLGPVVGLHVGSRLAIFIADRSLAHQALVQSGALFADRPKAPPLGKIVSCDQHNISSAGYGPTWRLLRRNLTLEILHPSRVKSYSHARKWVVEILNDRLNSQAKTGEPIQVVDHFRLSMFSLLVFMCFGDKLDQEKITEIEGVQRRLLLGFATFNVLNFWHPITKIVFRNRWRDFLKVLEDQMKVLTPLIRARKIAKEAKSENVMAYVDTLLDLELPEEKRKLTEEEIVSLCSEFLNGGTDTTSTSLQWIMANMVKYPEIQEKLVEEMKFVVGESEEVKEEDLGRIPYLKAVVLEGLRRHPPGHFVLPHQVTEETQLGGYRVPKDANVNFAVAEMGWDPKVWEDPMEFRPERFEKDGEGFEVDITGSREIKMMPFGVGRRICPGLGLALLHLEYFLANLVWKFRWERVATDEVSLEETQEFTIVMKVPLKPKLSARR